MLYKDNTQINFKLLMDHFFVNYKADLPHHAGAIVSSSAIIYNYYLHFFIFASKQNSEISFSLTQKMRILAYLSIFNAVNGKFREFQ